MEDFVLYNIYEELPMTPAGIVMGSALKAPMFQIMENLNVDHYGDDNGTDMRNIKDSAMVIKMAVRNAVGIASTLLTSSALIYLPDEPIIKEPQNVNF